MDEERLYKAEVLVIATLIATVTFQAGINPPGGVWQDQSDNHEAGRSIYASKRDAYYVFLVCNTFAFSTSILVIFLMTRKFPHRVEIFLANIAIIITYAFGIFAITPHDNVHLPKAFQSSPDENAPPPNVPDYLHHENFHFRYIFIAGFMPFLVSGLIHLVVACKRFS